MGVGGSPKWGTLLSTLWVPSFKQRHLQQLWELGPQCLQPSLGQMVWCQCVLFCKYLHIFLQFALFVL